MLLRRTAHPGGRAPGSGAPATGAEYIPARVGAQVSTGGAQGARGPWERGARAPALYRTST